MSIINYKDSIIPDWFRDENGNKVSVERTNEPKQVVGNKIILDYIPDIQYRVFINENFVEINIKDEITQPNEFKVDYTNGYIYVHESLDSQFLTIKRYYAKGLLYYPSSRVWTKLATDGSVSETLKDIEIEVDKALQLSDNIQQEENIRIENENTRVQNEIIRQSQEQDRQTNTTNAINTINNTNNAMEIWEDYDNEKVYVPLNKVQYQGSSYVNKLESISVPPTDTIHWQLISKKGQDGDGSGDMLKVQYDVNGNGIVDLAEDSERLSGKTLAEIYADIPEGITVTDSDINGNIVVNGAEVQVYDDTEIDNKIGILTEKVDTETPLNTTSQNLSGAVNEISTQMAESVQSLETHKAENVNQKEVHGLKIESGTWTPSIVGSTTNPTVDYIVTRAQYLKIGKLVKCNFFIRATATEGSGVLRIGGFPFIIRFTDEAGIVARSVIGNTALNFASFNSLSNNLTTIAIKKDSLINVEVSEINTGNQFDISGSIVYETH